MPGSGGIITVPCEERERCAPSSAPSKLQQSTTPTAKARALLRPSPRRRSSCAVPDPRRVATQLEPHQDQRPLQGRLPPSHRKARPVPSPGRAWGLSSGGPRTLPTSRGRHLGTTWRRASQHVFLRRTQGKERPPLRSSSPRQLRNCKTQGPCAATPPLTRCSSPSRRGCRAARVRQCTRAQ